MLLSILVPPLKLSTQLTTGPSNRPLNGSWAVA
jgi:hypothetical protein